MGSSISQSQGLLEPRGKGQGHDTRQLGSAPWVLTRYMELPHSLPSPARMLTLWGTEGLSVHHSKATKWWSMDSNPYQTLNSSHKQLPVFTKPLPEFVMLAEVSYFLLPLNGFVACHFSLLSSATLPIFLPQFELLALEASEEYKIGFMVHTAMQI